MRNIKLVIEYDGCDFCGWQKQKDYRSVQETIENSLYKCTGEEINLIASGRTDAGVHALGQVANFYTRSSIPAEKFKPVLNTSLPEDIRIIDSCQVDMSFHSRFTARRKRYKYYIYNGRQERPIYRNFTYQVYKPLDIELMRAGSRKFIGIIDFKSFMASKSKVDTTIRTIYSIDIVKKDEFIVITIEGRTFLRHMIRIMVGTLIDLGLGKISLEDLEEIIDSKDRRKAGKTVGPQGLFLEKVYY